MIYSDREVRLFRGVAVTIALATLAVAGLTWAEQKGGSAPSEIEVIAAVILGVLLYVAAEWLLPEPLPPPRTPRPQPAPRPMLAWQRDSAQSGTEGAQGTTPELTPAGDTPR